MVLLFNGFEEGANGTTITTANTGNAQDNAFDIVNIATGGTNRFSGLYQAHGTMSGLVATAATAAPTNFGWSTSLGTQTTLFGRVYIAIDTGTIASDAIVRFQNGATYGGGIQLTSAGKIAIQNAASAITATSTTVIGTGGIWARIEWQLVCGGAGSASLVVKIAYYATGSYDNATFTETLTDNTSAFGSAGSINEVLFGWGGSHANQPNLYFDDVAVSSTGFLGPAVLAATYPTFPNNGLGLIVSIFIGGAWVDITDLCRASSDIQISGRGRTNETQEINPASLTLTVNNNNGAFTPNNTQSPFYPYIQVNTRINVYVAAQSANNTVYTGYRFMGDVRRWPPSWDPTGTDNWADVTAGGVLTRYIQGGNIGSTIRRYMTIKTRSGWVGGTPPATLAPLYPIAYWPCEELTGASSFQNLIPTG